MFAEEEVPTDVLHAAGIPDNGKERIFNTPTGLYVDLPHPSG